MDFNKLLKESGQQAFPRDSKTITEDNGYVKTSALDIKRSFMYGKDYVAAYGTTVSSLENEKQTVSDDCVVMFDDTTHGYPASLKAFSKYQILTKPNGKTQGVAVKKDATVYLSKKMTEPFSATIWNGDVLQGKVGDYLVANVANNDYRIVASEIFLKSYKQGE